MFFGEQTTGHCMYRLNQEKRTNQRYYQLLSHCFESGQFIQSIVPLFNLSPGGKAEIEKGGKAKLGAGAPDAGPPDLKPETRRNPKQGKKITEH